MWNILAIFIFCNSSGWPNMIIITYMYDAHNSPVMKQWIDILWKFLGKSCRWVIVTWSCTVWSNECNYHTVRSLLHSNLDFDFLHCSLPKVELPDRTKEEAKIISDFLKNELSKGILQSTFSEYRRVHINLGIYALRKWLYPLNHIIILYIYMYI